MSETNNPERMDVWREFLATFKTVMGALEREEINAPGGIAVSWFDVLINLSEATDGRLRMQDLAEAVMLSPSGLTRRIDRLEAEGLVVRERSTDDRRSAYTALTPKGRDVVARIVPGHVRRVEELFRRHLTDAEVRHMRSAFRKIVEATD